RPHQRAQQHRCHREHVLQRAVRPRRGRPGHRPGRRPARRGHPDPDLPGQAVPRAGGHAMSATTAEDRTAVTPKKSRGAGRLKDGRQRSPFSMVIMLLLAVLWSLPTLGLLITSFRTRDAAETSGWWEAFWKGGWTTGNYRQVFEQADLGNAFLNGILVAVPATI